MSENVSIPEAPVNEPVTMINAFTVPAAEADRFLELWRHNAAAMAAQPGFIRTRMYRSLVADVELRFITHAEWVSGKALEQARTDPQWRASMRRMMDDPDLHVTPRPGVYEVALDVRPGDRP
ncbi:antibiotic biosynthesis monooxygenase family protein [Nocardia sp. CA-119907]|uniref:antibiotic biosynthesis monooxygenase family protein n=1 Tax=Nocardia sp. CA-119907 TaxID=3239973 RepID=UPI003D990CF4